MADNVAITAGSGTSIATDDIGGVQYQRVKVTYGADGSATDVSSAAPLPIAGVATRVPANNAAALPVRLTGQEVFNCSFSNVGASVLSSDFIAPIVGTGVTYNQTAGALNILTGTNTNAEFLTRSVLAFQGSMRFKFSILSSQRIANQNLAIMLADLIGAGLSFTINSATSVTVTLTAHGYTAQNVGQFMNLGGIVGAAGVPGRYAIASVPTADTITFTVAGWPASGSGTLTLFGHNYVRNLINGTTATNIFVDAQRRGWATGDTTATINTTASPGTIMVNELTGREVIWSDHLRITSTLNVTVRATRHENIPDDNLDLYVFVWSFNGTSAPASTTTWTISFLSVEKFPNTPVYIQGVRAQGTMNPLPVSQQGSITVGTALPAGTNAIGDVGVQVRANATGAASINHVVSVAGTNAANIKAGAGRVYGWQLCNRGAADAFVKFHNSASAPTAGAGVVLSICLKAGQRSDVSLPMGIAFSSGIGRTLVTGALDADTTGVGAGDVVGDIFFA